MANQQHVDDEDYRIAVTACRRAQQSDDYNDEPGHFIVHKGKVIHFRRAHFSTDLKNGADLDLALRYGHENVPASEKFYLFCAPFQLEDGSGTVKSQAHRFDVGANPVYCSPYIKPAASPNKAKIIREEYKIRMYTTEEEPYDARNKKPGLIYLRMNSARRYEFLKKILYGRV